MQTPKNPLIAVFSKTRANPEKVKAHLTSTSHVTENYFFVDRYYRLSSLARLSIESEILRSLNFYDVISEFAESKSRKKYF